MISKTRVMLYVDDVERISNFWVNDFGAELTEQIELPEGFKGVVLTISPGTELELFAKEFIRKYSPEVLENVPSLMFFSENFEELYNRLENTGEIIVNNGVSTFNFQDPEGNYFVVAKA